MSTLTKKQRDALPLADFGDPERRLFPIVDPSDVEGAAHLIGKAHNPDAVRKRVVAIAKRKGAAFVAKLPDAWKGDQHESSAPSPAAAGAAAATVALVEAGALVELAPVTEPGALVGVA